jgi:uncharacterized protein YbcC (UPF0753/DUF2309 family)
MGQIIAWSCLDEDLHSKAGCELFRVIISENPDIFTDAFKKDIYEAARLTIELEDSFLDNAFKLGEAEGLTLHQMKNFIRHRANLKLQELGLKANWKNNYKIDMDALVHPLLFRIVCSYLDQGIAIWNFPIEHKGLLSSIKELERMSYSSIFNSKRVRDLLLNNNCSMEHLLEILVGEETLYAQYLYDQQFAHQGWSGMVSFIEDNPNALLDTKKITLHDFIVFELLLEINALDSQYGDNWKPVKDTLKERPTPLFNPVKVTELNEIIMLWQDAYEWTYYDQVLAGVQLGFDNKAPKTAKSFQALFCIDDRECSIRRYVELNDENCETFGTPGFFGVEFLPLIQHSE